MLPSDWNFSREFNFMTLSREIIFRAYHIGELPGWDRKRTVLVYTYFK